MRYSAKIREPSGSLIYGSWIAAFTGNITLVDQLVTGSMIVPTVGGFDLISTGTVRIMEFLGVLIYNIVLSRAFCGFCCGFRCRFRCRFSRRFGHQLRCRFCCRFGRRLRCWFCRRFGHRFRCRYCCRFGRRLRYRYGRMLGHRLRFRLRGGFRCFHSDHAGSCTFNISSSRSWNLHKAQ